jgi:hypothetical protein
MRKQYYKKGFVVVIVLVTMVLLLATGAALLNLGFKARLNSARVCSDICAKSAVDAAVAKALSHINSECSSGTLKDSALPQAENVPLEYCNATFSYDIIKNGGNYVIRATGFSGPVRKTAGAVLKSQGSSPFEYGALVKGSIVIGNGMTVAAYNPDDPTAPVGTYPVTIGTLRSLSAGVGVNGTVYGDAFCGVGGDPDVVISGEENITGDTYALTQAPQIPLPVMPTDLVNHGTGLTVSAETVTLTPADNGIYYNLKLESKGTPGVVIIDGGTVTIGLETALQMGKDSEIIVNEGSTLILYINQGISSMNGASISYNSTDIDPSHIQLYGTGDAPEGSDYVWALKSKDVFQGVIYAPDAFVSYNSSSKMIGSVVCSSFMADSGCEFLYDMSLASATNLALDTGGGPPTGFTISRWSE